MMSEPEQTSEPRNTARVSPWVIAAALGATLTPLVSGAALYVSLRLAREQAAQLRAIHEEVRAVGAEVQATTAATWVETKETAHTCHAYNERFECSVTNTTERPISACWTASLAQKQGGGTMKSSPLCTGRLAPRETKTIAVPWLRGEAKDICNVPTQFGLRLEWEKCDFTMHPTNPPAAPIASDTRTTENRAASAK